MLPKTPPWLLLIHQIPTKPDYLRVKIGRRLQQVGAVAVKSTVYALPNTETCRENFEWVLREILGGGGEAMLFEGELVGGLEPEGLRALFEQARNRDYREIAEEARLTAERWEVAGQHGEGPSPAIVLGRLERRLAAVRALDFFQAPEGRAAEEALGVLRDALRGPRESPTPAPPSPDRPRGRIWVTRAGVEEDRIASAWLIRRFIDSEASFRFVSPDSLRREGEIGFDMYDGEYTHDGDRCTFEVLLDRFGLRDKALVALGEIVHDIDLKDGKFSRPETAGFERFVQGLLRAAPDDGERLAKGGAFLDALYAAFEEER